MRVCVCVFVYVVLEADAKLTYIDNEQIHDKADLILSSFARNLKGVCVRCHAYGGIVGHCSRVAVVQGLELIRRAPRASIRRFAPFT